MNIQIGGVEYDRRELEAIDEAFQKNFLLRRLVMVYDVGLDEASNAHLQHVLHDLEAVRYRAWLMLRHNGLDLEDAGALVTDDNVIDVFSVLWSDPVRVVEGAAEDELRQIIADRKAKNTPPDPKTE